MLEKTKPLFRRWLPCWLVCLTLPCLFNFLGKWRYINWNEGHSESRSLQDMADLWKQVAKYVLNKRPAFNSKPFKSICYVGLAPEKIMHFKIDRLLLFYCADFPNPRNPSPSILPSAARLPFSHQLPTKLYFVCPRPSLQYFTDHTLPPATHFTICYPPSPPNLFFLNLLRLLLVVAV